ncbi:acyl-CoA dehydrogenase family protein [Actinocorallia longicatena]|uniref:DNA alkylation response protein n=1 Tax=Actinocorallia longicatena TaxID=111803 RepID=A0ABP6QGP8_9ACTN
MDTTRRYATERYQGAASLNWYSSDPSLRAQLRRHLGDDALAWAEPHLVEAGALMSGLVETCARSTDRDPPRLERYDRWGHEVSEVVMPPSFETARRALVAGSFTRPGFLAEARGHGANPVALGMAWNYLLYQADIGMGCALGTGGDMVVLLAEAFAPADVKERVREIFADGMFSGEAAQLLTERTGGSDLAALESVAHRAGPASDAWELTGVKWFASNANGSAFVVMARPEAAAEIAPFLVLKERRDGSPNAISVRRLKDKLGTRSVASAEIGFSGAEAFLLAPERRSDGRGLGRMMELTNGARLGIALMGLACARRSLVESVLYARSREAFGRRLIDQPLMRRKLAELVVEVEAAQVLVFDGFLHRQRLTPALAKLRAARLGVTAAGDAVEIHGGNGYIEQWPVARILRDAHVNPIWEGGDNILCLDVRRALRKGAYEEFRSRLAGLSAEVPLDDLDKTVAAWHALPDDVAEARLYPLARYMTDVHTAALLQDHGRPEVARLYTERHLTDPGPLRGMDRPDDLGGFDELLAGALTAGD